MIFEIIFWISLSSLFHTYLVFPLLIRFLAKGKKGNTIVYNIDEELPDISIIMAVHNEERILEEKIKSVFNSGYPVEKITFYIGSDASFDKSDKIIRDRAVQHPQIEFTRFNQRIGKVQIINELILQNSNQIIVFTDACAILTQDALFHLVKHFKNNQIHVVGGKMGRRQNFTGEIAFLEWSYFEGEFSVKDAESKLWGNMIGAFGAFYAVRQKYLELVPSNFLSDDFYISMKAIEKGGKAIFVPEAIAFEDVPGTMKEEFKRKSRIATGNFQNLRVFYPLLVSRRCGLAFSFLSHKVLRWFGPVFIILAIICLSFLSTKNSFYNIMFIIMMLSLIAPFIDLFLQKIRIHIIILRFISHFYYMNIALLTGLFRYMKGVKSNVWQPTRRESA